MKKQSHFSVSPTKFQKKIYKIIAWINVLFIIALLAAYLSTIVNPSQFVWLAYFGMAFPVIFIGNIVLTLFWIAAKSKLFLYSLILLLFGFEFIGRTIQFNPVNLFRNPDSNHYSLMSFNVRMFDKYNWIADTNTENKILAYIQKQNPDILCLQENFSSITDGNVHKKIVEKLSYKYATNQLAHNNIAIKAGTAIYSKHPIVNKGAIYTTEKRQIGLFADIVISTDTIRVYNFHLASVHLAAADYQALDSLVNGAEHLQFNNMHSIIRKLNKAFLIRSIQVEAMNMQLNNCPYEMLLCGDFNDTPVSYTYNQVPEKLNDAFKSSGFGFGTTYFSSFMAFRIDYIFHSGKIEVSNYRTHKIQLSDHKPISIAFTLSYPDEF